MIGTIITGIAKPVIAGAMSITMALNGLFTGPAGEYSKLQSKAMAMTPAKTATEISLMLDIEKLSELTGGEFNEEEIGVIPGIYKDGKIDISATIYTISDLDNTKLAISLTENLADGYAVYLDENGLAVTPKLVDAALQIYSALDGDGADMYEAYTTYFADNGIYLEWNNLFNVEYDEEDMTLIATLSQYFGVIVDDVVKIITDEENLKALEDIFKPLFDEVGKYYAKTDSGYGMKLTGVQLIEFYGDVFGTMYSEETANKLFDYALGIIDDIDYIKYYEIIKAFYPELASAEIPAGITNQQLAMIARSEVEPARADFIDMYTQQDAEEFVELLDYIIAGEDKNNKYPDEYDVYVAIAKPFLENSYVESNISEKNGAIYENEKLVIADDKATYLELGITTGVSVFEGTLPEAAAVVPFEKRVDSQEIDNKIGYKKAVEYGLDSIEISWTSGMYPEVGEVYIYSPYFYVYYDVAMVEAIKKDPTFLALSEERQQQILSVYSEDDKQFSGCTSSAHIIDGSVYLPLRQLMENAGYEVSWDGEARKAYVTVDGKKTEMTGIIINDRTYVKVRDFEKLGATVEYNEEFYRENAHNDYEKECTATITFKKAEKPGVDAFTAEGIIGSIYAQKAPLFMTGTMPVDMTDEFSYGTYLGLKEEDIAAVKDAAVTESMIGSQAYSLVVVRVAEGADANALAAKMKEGINPRKWICVQADDIKCTVIGDLICFCMISSEYKDAFTADDAINAFTKVVNGEAEYIG